ncbi:WD40-repeat-containing domain protein [Blastocladiella britannica]|nr:WD40-repeat-containing domain protein [Blastocladiella britannica]
MTAPIIDGPPGLVEARATLLGHSEAAWSLAWHPSGSLLASTSSDKTVRLWGPTTPLASSSTNSEWNCKTTLDGGHKRTVRSVAFAPAGGAAGTLATASFDATIGIWDRDVAAMDAEDALGNAELEYDYAATLEGHESEAKCVAWSSDGALLATCSRDKSVWIWEVLEDNDFECLSVLQQHSQDVKMVRWHPSAEYLLSASYDDTIRVWRDDTDDWTCSAVVRGHSSSVWAVDFDASGDHFASVSDDRSLRVWRFAGPESVSPVTVVADAHDGPIFSVSWNRHAHVLATAGGDNAVRLWQWDAATGSLALWATIRNAHGMQDVNCVAWNPMAAHRGWLATAGDDGAVKLWWVNL